MDLVLAGFAKGAPPDHRLVVKAHPLEDGRENLPQLVRKLAKQHGMAHRTHLLTGGKLAQLLDRAQRGATLNSTAAEQVLWRGLPLKAFGKATYNRPECVLDQQLAEFFTRPQQPDTDAYAIYRRFLLRPSQISGGFYANAPRNTLLRRLRDLLLDPDSPYDALRNCPASARQHIRVVT